MINNLVDCRKCGCNYLINTGLMGDGSINPIDGEILKQVGKWISVNKEFIYNAKPCGVKADGAEILFDNESYYAVIKDVAMSADPNVQLNCDTKKIKIYANIKEAEWLDDGSKAKIVNGEVIVEPFSYGRSYSLRVLKFYL